MDHAAVVHGVERRVPSPSVGCTGLGSGHLQPASTPSVCAVSSAAAAYTTVRERAVHAATLYRTTSPRLPAEQLLHRRLLHRTACPLSQQQQFCVSRRPRPVAGVALLSSDLCRSDLWILQSAYVGAYSNAHDDPMTGTIRRHTVGHTLRIKTPDIA